MKTDLFRRNSIYLDDEVYFYCESLAKALVHGTEAAITVDEFTRNYLREKITTEHPELILLYEEKQALRQQNKKTYEALDEKVIKLLKGNDL